MKKQYLTPNMQLEVIANEDILTATGAGESIGWGAYDGATDANSLY